MATARKWYHLEADTVSVFKDNLVESTTTCGALHKEHSSTDMLKTTWESLTTDMVPCTESTDKLRVMSAQFNEIEVMRDQRAYHQIPRMAAEAYAKRATDPESMQALEASDSAATQISPCPTSITSWLSEASQPEAEFEASEVDEEEEEEEQEDAQEFDPWSKHSSTPRRPLLLSLELPAIETRRFCVRPRRRSLVHQYLAQACASATDSQSNPMTRPKSKPAKQSPTALFGPSLQLKSFDQWLKGVGDKTEISGPFDQQQRWRLMHERPL